MPRKFSSIRQADLDRQLERAGMTNADAVSDVDARAMILEWERHQKLNSITAIMQRLRQAFREKHEAVSRTRAVDDHDQPEAEHPSLNQWRLFLASDDFAAFVCSCLRLEVADNDPSLSTANWRHDMERKYGQHVLGSLFKACIASAVDEWEQRHRVHQARGKTVDPDEAAMVEAMRELRDAVAE